MTSRRVVLVALAPPAALLAVLWAAHTLDHLTGWYDPRWRT